MFVRSPIRVWAMLQLFSLIFFSLCVQTLSETRSSITQTNEITINDHNTLKSNQRTSAVVVVDVDSDATLGRPRKGRPPPGWGTKKWKPRKGRPKHLGPPAPPAFHLPPPPPPPPSFKFPVPPPSPSLSPSSAPLSLELELGYCEEPVLPAGYYALCEHTPHPTSNKAAVKERDQCNVICEFDGYSGRPDVSIITCQKNTSQDKDKGSMGWSKLPSSGCSRDRCKTPLVSEVFSYSCSDGTSSTNQKGKDKSVDGSEYGTVCTVECDSKTYTGIQKNWISAATYATETLFFV